MQKIRKIPENIENVNSESVGKKYDLLNSRYGHELIGILAEHCRDPSLMVRKQIVGSLTEIVKAYPDHQVVINKFVEGVFPLILDVEQKAAEKVHECIWEVLFGNIVSFDKAVKTRHFLPWKILNATEKLKMTSYLSRACSQWAKDKMLKPSLLTMLRTHIDTENSNSGTSSTYTLFENSSKCLI